MMSRRLRLVAGGVLVLTLVIIGRLFFWQVVKGGELAAAAESQRTSRNLVEAPRGEILANDRFPLVGNEERYLLWASLPDLKESKVEVARRLAPLVAVSDEATDSGKLVEREQSEEERLGELLSRKDVVWVPIKHGLKEGEKQKIEEWKIPGLGFLTEAVRSYPEGSMSAHLVGFLGKNEVGESQGYFGLEGFYQVSLAGRRGSLVEEKDAAGHPILIGRQERIEAVAGATLVTNIDRAIEYQAAKYLKAGLEKYGASAGSVVVMEPDTGAVLAMVSLPGYDPANFGRFDRSLFPNPAVATSYEPGSTFKVLVMAAGLDGEVVKPETRCPVCDKSLEVGDAVVRTWNDKYFPDETMVEVIQHSDNVGMAWLAGEVGVEKMRSYLGKFGVGKVTGIDLEEEATVGLRGVGEWTSVDLATAGFGQGVAVTPIQMVTAVAAIANGGVLMRPQVVQKLEGLGWEKKMEPEVVGRVISPETAREVMGMMVNAVDKGEAKWAKPKGYRIAGKTGTAQIPVAGHYDKEKTIASFVGFAPADKPVFVMLVTLREPKSSPWGSETAAPLWFSIAKEILLYKGVPAGG